MVCARVGRCPRSGAAPEAAARGRGRSTLPHESWNDPPLPPPPSLPYSLDTSRPSFGTNRTRPEEQERHRHRQVLPGADAPGTPSPPSPRRTPRIGARGPLLTAAVAARRRGVCNLFSAEQGPLTRGAAGQAFSRHVVKHRNKLLRRPAGHRGGLMVSSEEQDRPMARLLSPRLWCVRRHYGRDPECEASPWRSAADWLRARAWWHTWSQHGVSAVCPQVLAPGGHTDCTRAGKRDDYGQRPFAARARAVPSLPPPYCCPYPCPYCILLPSLPRARAVLSLPPTRTPARPPAREAPRGGAGAREPPRRRPGPRAVHILSHEYESSSFHGVSNPKDASPR
jgi:hypothetical protein